MLWKEIARDDRGPPCGDDGDVQCLWWDSCTDKWYCDFMTERERRDCISFDIEYADECKHDGNRHWYCDESVELKEALKDVTRDLDLPTDHLYIETYVETEGGHLPVVLEVEDKKEEVDENNDMKLKVLRRFEIVSLPISKDENVIALNANPTEEFLKRNVGSCPYLRYVPILNEKNEVTHVMVKDYLFDDREEISIVASKSGDDVQFLETY